MIVVRLSNKKEFTSDQGVSLLDSARAQGIALEYSCRTGRCGVCKARVIEGNSREIFSEPGLSQQDAAAGYILTCCRTAVTNLTLDIEDLGELAGIQVKTIPCRIDSIERITDDVLLVTLRTPPNNKLFHR